MATAMLGMALAVGWTPPAAAEIVDPAGYDSILRRIVRAGQVDYNTLATRRMHLERYLEALAEVDTHSGTRDEQMALWINAYNAGTLRLLLDHYPLRRSSLVGYLFPEKSLLQIEGAWNRAQLRVGGVRFSLNEIAHKILRKRFQQPLVLFALASGARGSPRLRGEAYLGPGLQAQLESSARAYLDDPEHGFRIDREDRSVWISRLFLWYGRDFVAGYAEGPLSQTGRFSQTEAAALHFIRQRRPAEERAFLDRGEFRLRYLGHDWMLNGR